MRIESAIILSVLIACCSTTEQKGASQKSIQGLWSFVDSNGLYWERVFVDSMFWSYSDEIGHQKHKILMKSDTVIGQYADGSREIKFIISSLRNDSLSIFGPGWRGTYVRLRYPYDFRRIVAGDTVLEWVYMEDYMKRKQEWESVHPPK